MRGTPTRLDDFSGGIRVADARGEGARNELQYAFNFRINPDTRLLSQRAAHLTETNLSAAGHSLYTVSGDASLGGTLAGHMIYVVGNAITDRITSTSMWTASNSSPWNFALARSGTTSTLLGLNGQEAIKWTGGPAAAWTATSGTFPLYGNYILYHGGRVWVARYALAANPALYASSIAWSEIQDANTWPAENTLALNPGTGFLTGIGKSGPNLLVFKETETHLIYDLDTGANRQISSDIGCVSHRTIVETPRGTYFLTRDHGLALFDGSQIKLIEDKLNFAHIVPGSFNSAISNAVYFQDRLWLNVNQPTGMTKLYEYDPTHDAWWIHDRAMNQMGVYSTTYTENPRLYGVDKTVTPGLSTYPLAFMFGAQNIAADYSESGTPVALGGYIETPDLDFGVQQRKRLRAIEIEGHGRMTPSVGIDGSTGYYAYPVTAFDTNTYINRQRIAGRGVNNTFRFKLSTAPLTPIESLRRQDIRALTFYVDRRED